MPAPSHSIFTGQMLFLMANLQCRSTEGSYWCEILRTLVKLAVWLSGIVVRRMNKVTLRWAWLVLGWVTLFGRIPPCYVTNLT